MMATATGDKELSSENQSTLVKPMDVQMTCTDEPKKASSQSHEHKPRATCPLPQKASGIIRDSSQFYGRQIAADSFQQELDNMSDSKDSCLMYKHSVITAPRDVMGGQERNEDWNSPVQNYSSTGNVFCSENSLPVAAHQRAMRLFVPDDQKDDHYWNKRMKNNDSARRSRNKRKDIEKRMHERLVDLEKENIKLRHELAALRRRYCGDSCQSSVSKDIKYISTLPSPLSKTTTTTYSTQRSFVSDELLPSEPSCTAFRKTLPSLDYGFSADIADYIEKTLYVKVPRRPTVTRTESGESYTSNCDSEIATHRALDLNRQCNPDSEVCEALSSDGDNSGSDQRRSCFKTTSSAQRSFVSDELLSSEHSCTAFRKTLPSLDYGYSADIADYIEKTFYVKVPRRSTVTRTESGESYTSNCDSEIPTPRALELNRQCNPDSEVCEALSSDGDSSGSNQRRRCYKTSDSSSLEDNTSPADPTMYPLKCRWKRRMMSSHAHLPE